MHRPIPRIRDTKADWTVRPIDIVLALTAGALFLVGLLHLIADFSSAF